MKYIYLDQNKWIELAKGLKKEDLKYIKLYEFIIKKLNNGAWAFPLSSIHITETMKRRDETSRKDILDLMFTISRGYGIYDYMTADTVEFNYWVSNKNVDFSKLKSTIIKQDWMTIIGSSLENMCNDRNFSINELTKIKRMIKERPYDREIFDLICNVMNNNIVEDEEFYYRCYEKGRKDFLSWKDKIKDLDEYKEKHLYPAYLIVVFFQLYRDKIINLQPIEEENIRDLFEKNKKTRVQLFPI